MPPAGVPLDTLAGPSYPGGMTRWVPFHDLVAGVATLALLAAIVLLTALEAAIPTQISTGFTLALGWTFRGGYQLQNELRHRNRSNDGK